jgi:TonB family protein
MKTPICWGFAIFALLIFSQRSPLLQSSDNSKLWPIHLESLDYPKIARATRISGEVVLRLKVSAAGTVESVERVSGPRILAEEAERNAEKWVFTSGKAGLVHVTYEFQLRNPPTEKEVIPTVIFDLPDHVLVVSLQRETIVD